MQKYRRNAKIDNNQNAIVKALRKLLGVTVQVEHDDILVGHKGKTYWYEIKSPDAVSKKTGKINDSFLKPSQIKLLKEWRGHYKIVWSIEQILEDLSI